MGSILSAGTPLEILSLCLYPCSPSHSVSKLNKSLKRKDSKSHKDGYKIKYYKGVFTTQVVWYCYIVDPQLKKIPEKEYRFKREKAIITTVPFQDICLFLSLNDDF